MLHRCSPFCPDPAPESAELCVRSAGNYIDDMLTVLRSSNVPLTWMLIQGVLFAGLTMLVTARTTVMKLIQHAGPAFLLVDFPNWTRKCSMCIAIMSERWKDDLLAKLDAQFEVLASDTLKMIATSFTEIDKSTSNTQTPVLTQNSEPSAAFGNSGSSNTADWLNSADNTYMDTTIPANWDFPQDFNDFLGFDNSQPFWTIFPTQSGFDVLDNLGTDQNQVQDHFTLYQGTAEDQLITLP